MTAAVQTGGQRATSPRALTTVTDGERPGRASVQASADAVADLWASAWSRLTVEHLDLSGPARLLDAVREWRQFYDAPKRGRG
jgi:hypothetical protein